MDNHSEALRCLLCKRPGCAMACPVSTDIPGTMRLYREGRMEEAGAFLFGNNPMSCITCRVCDRERFCLGHCVLARRGAPVHWHEIEKELSSEYLKKAFVKVPEVIRGSVAIIGAGPAGITAALMLRREGFAVDLYDDHERIGGVLRYGIPAFRLEKSFLDEYERILRECGVRFHGCSRVRVKDIYGSCDAVIVAGGAWKPRRLAIPGEDDPSVIYALDYLADHDRPSLGPKVLVIGGGNVTMDASRTALRSGSDTYVYYRKTFENMPASSLEIEDAKADGVKFVLFSVPVSLRHEGGKHYAIMRKCENITTDDGRIATRTIEGSEFEVEYDQLIVAISENIDYGVFEGLDLQMDPKGHPLVDESGQVSQDGIYLCGDFLLGPQTVVDAVASAKKAVGAIAAKSAE